MVLTPFYLDWTFWTAVAALLALVLSQLPPLYVLLRPARLEVEAFDRIQVTHGLGSPNALLHAIVRNTGGRGLIVKALSLQFKRDNEDEFELPGRGYYQSLADQNAVILTSFTLPSMGEWKHVINFFAPLSSADERKLNEVKSAIRNSIMSKKILPENEKVLVEAAPEVVAPAYELFRRQFKWEPGEYEVTLSIKTEPKSACIQRKFRMTIFESDTTQLKDYAERYKYGAGVFYSDTELAPVFLPLKAV